MLQGLEAVRLAGKVAVQQPPTGISQLQLSLPPHHHQHPYCVHHAASTLACTWSSMRAISGDTSSTTPGRSRAGSA